MRPQELILQVAAAELGVHETSNNQGPGIDKYWKATTYPDGMADRQPWCSAFTSWCVQEADRRSDQLRFPIPPRWPAVAQWVPWAKSPQVNAVVFRPGDPKMTPLAGDIVIFLPHFSHVGIVEKFESGIVFTVEGNTDDQGSREGLRVARKRRLPSICGSFIRLLAVGESK